MKPISVRFACFGPYMQEQSIDFRELERNGLFLICGETGSGKTTILDAICYALYGKSSGGGRGELQDMRCKRAGAGDKTFVEYIFSSGPETYRFYREMKPKKQQKASLEAGKPLTYNEDFECQIRRDGEFVPMEDTKATQKYINGKAEEILGLQYDQFRQVVILPQGQFEKLLTSKSDEKEKILVTLFHAQKWNRIADSICSRITRESRILDGEKTAIDTRLRDLRCEDLEGLREKVRTGQETLTKLENQLKLTRAAKEQAAKDLEEKKQQDKDFAEADRLRKIRDSLLNQAPAREKDRQALEDSRRAEKITPIYHAYMEKGEKAADADETLKNQKEKYEAARIDLQKLEKEKQTHEDSRQGYEAEKKRRILLESKEALYGSLNENEIRRQMAETQLSGAEKALKAAETEQSIKTTALSQAVDAQNEAMEAFRRGQALYMKSIGAVLARNLKEGEKCPVCGSRVHPEPAAQTEEMVSEEELNQLEKAMQRALNQADRARMDQTQAAQAFQEAKLTRARCRQQLDSAENLCQAALSQRLEGVADDKQRLAALRALKTSIDRFEETDRSMQKRLNEADAACRSRKDLARQAARDASRAENASREAELLWREALEEQRFLSEQAYLDACMEPDIRQELQQQVVQYDTDLRNSEQALARQETLVSDRQRPDVAEAQEAFQQAEEALEQQSQNRAVQKSDLDAWTGTLEELEKQIPDYRARRQTCEENMEFARRLRGDSGVSLQRYVLGVMLTSITREANRLLKGVYGGRYQLYRTNESMGRSRKRGLELEVADQDGRRSVNSLSGGEKFLLSLSLAIGLSTVVQAQGGGIRLEAMFIDEGFGSLDSSTIGDAMEILEYVRRSSGIVGIISHVERLSETIPAKIQITKTKNGSICKVCT